MVYIDNKDEESFGLDSARREGMDCCICSPMASVYKPPRNTICPSCYEGAKGMSAFLNKLDGSGGRELGCSPNSHGLRLGPSKGLSDTFKWMKEMKEAEETLNEKLGFLDGLLVAFRDGIHTDILIRPGCGPAIPAHRAVLATRSEIFRTLLASDEYKAPAEDTISLPELTHEELRCLLEFLYSGDLLDEQAEKHTHSLLIAADKYDIPYLKSFCEQQILQSLGPSNALDVLEVAQVCSNTTLKKRAMRSIVNNADDVVFSKRYDEFAPKNAQLCVEITRALLLEMKDKRANGVPYYVGTGLNET